MVGSGATGEGDAKSARLMPTSFMNCLLWLGIHAQPTAPFVFRHTSQRECGYKFGDKACSLMTIPALSFSLSVWRTPDHLPLVAQNESDPRLCFLFGSWLLLARKYAIKLGNKLPMRVICSSLQYVQQAHCVLHPPTYRVNHQVNM